jgi:hypothetical protein
MSVTVQEPSSARTWTGAELARCASVILAVVLSMPSGPVMLAAMYASNDCPLSASTTRPSQSMLNPYSKRVPGSNTSGEVNAASLPGMMLGVPVSCS